MWKCPKCGRTFRNRNQWHTCVKIDENEFLDHVYPHALELYDCLKKSLSDLSVAFEVEAVKNCIYFITHYRFLAVKFHPQSIDVEFVLNRELNIFPVIKSVKYSKQLWWHIIRIEKKEELTSEIMNWVLVASKIENKS